MKRAAVLCLAAACFPSAGAAQASNISWSYHFVSSGHDTNIITNNHAFGIVSLPGNGSGHLTTAAGSTTDISTKISSFSTATKSHSQSVNIPFAIDLKITDKASGLSEFVSFGGTLSGNIWNNGSTLQAHFTSPLTAAVDIDHHLFTVSFESFKAPEGQGHPGNFTFDVKTSHNPEPSTLVLAAIGLPFFGLTLRRRRRVG